MRRDDIKPGGVYAFHEGRPRSLLDASFTPWLVLDNRYYTRDDDGRISLAPAGARPHAYRHNLGQVGLPAVSVAPDDNRSYESAIAQLREYMHGDLAAFHDQQLVTRWSGQVLGRYHLVTSVAHLHGEYAEMMASQYTELVWRCAALGINLDEERPGLPQQVLLSYDQMRRLLDIAEGNVISCTGMEPAPGSPESA